MFHSLNLKPTKQIAKSKVEPSHLTPHTGDATQSPALLLLLSHLCRAEQPQTSTSEGSNFPRETRGEPDLSCQIGLRRVGKACECIHCTQRHKQGDYNPIKERGKARVT